VLSLQFVDQFDPCFDLFQPLVITGQALGIIPKCIGRILQMIVNVVQLRFRDRKARIDLFDLPDSISDDS